MMFSPGWFLFCKVRQPRHPKITFGDFFLPVDLHWNSSNDSSSFKLWAPGSRTTWYSIGYMIFSTLSHLSLCGGSDSSSEWQSVCRKKSCPGWTSHFIYSISLSGSHWVTVWLTGLGVSSEFGIKPNWEHPYRLPFVSYSGQGGCKKKHRDLHLAVDTACAPKFLKALNTCKGTGVKLP